MICGRCPAGGPALTDGRRDVVQARKRDRYALCPRQTAIGAARAFRTGSIWTLGRGPHVVLRVSFLFLTETADCVRRFVLRRTLFGASLGRGARAVVSATRRRLHPLRLRSPGCPRSS